MDYIEQIGGDHYQAAYQHWDWVGETGLGYFEGNATKYLARAHKKGGLVDLKKAQSYIQKLQTSPWRSAAGWRPGWSPSKLARFLGASQLNDTPEGLLIVLIDSWKSDDDLATIDSDLGELIRAYEH